MDLGWILFEPGKVFIVTEPGFSTDFATSLEDKIKVKCEDSLSSRIFVFNKKYIMLNYRDNRKSQLNTYSLNHGLENVKLLAIKGT